MLNYNTYDVNDIVNVYSDSIIDIEIDYIKSINKYVIMLLTPYNADICYTNKDVAQYVIKKLSCISADRKHWIDTDNLLWAMLDCLYGYKQNIKNQNRI